MQCLLVTRRAWQAEVQNEKRRHEDQRARQSHLPESQPGQQRPGDRPQYGSQLPAYRKQREPLSAAAFTACFAVGSRFCQQGFDRRGEQRAADAGQAGAENNRAQAVAESQQQVASHPDNAAAQNNAAGAIAVGKCAAKDKHALLGKGSQPQDQADSAAGKQHIVTQKDRQKRDDGVKADIKDKLAAQ